MTGLCLLFQGDWFRARIILDLLRDIVIESRDNGILMEVYELIGRTLEQGFNFNLAIVAYKKQMQISWVIDNKTFEIRAY